MPQIELQMPRPHPKQLEFFEATERYVCYGGARGGGKTWAIIWKSILLALSLPGIKILIVRKTYKDLSEGFLLPMLEILRDIPTVKYKDDFKSFFFQVQNKQSRIKLGYCDSDADLGQYQTAEYDVIFFEEATQFTENQFRSISASCRGTNPDFPRRVYLTCNPGDVGHEWVMRLFIEKKYVGKEKAENYRFIQAKVSDNPSVNPEYIEFLESLPEGKRQAWLDGDWSVFAGQYFSEFDEKIHVVEPFAIPSHWRRYFTVDYGLDMCAGLWIAQDEKGNSFVYRELCKSDLIISEAAKRICEMDMGEDIRIRYAPPDLWGRKSESGKSTVDQFADYGLYFDRSSNSRIPGWLAVKEHIKVETLKDGTKTSKLKIFKNCTNLIYCLPKLIYDKDQSGDVSNEPHEITHAPDALRGYCVMYNESTKPLEPPPHKSPFKFTLPSSEPSLIGIGDKIIPV